MQFKLSFRPKLIRVTTVSESLSLLLRGQLRFLNDYMDVVGLASGEDVLRYVAEREGIRVIHVDMARRISIGADLISVVRLIYVFFKENPDVVHANTPKGSLLAMFSAWLVGVPNRVYTVTGLRFETTRGGFRLLLKTMERLTCFFATKVIPEGDGVGAALVREGITMKPLLKLHNGNINGVDLAYFKRTVDLLEGAAQIRRSIDAGDGGIVFGYVGRLVKDKGINELVSAFVRFYRDYRKARLLLVGSFDDGLDPLLPQTMDYIRSCPGIFSVGYKSELRCYYLSFDAFFLPSYREGFPNSVLQAGAMGIASVVTNISGCNEIIKNGFNGWIIPSRSEDDLYGIMHKLTVAGKSQLESMGYNARSEVERRFDQRSVWDATLAMYGGLRF